jgi:hypothetical protein
MLAVFVRFWLTTNPPLLEPAQAAARAQAGNGMTPSSRRSAAVLRRDRSCARKSPKISHEIERAEQPPAAGPDEVISRRVTGIKPSTTEQPVLAQYGTSSFQAKALECGSRCENS